MSISKYYRSKILKSILVEKNKVAPVCRKLHVDRSTVYDWIKELLDLKKEERVDLRVMTLTEEKFDILFKKWTSKKSVQNRKNL